MNRTIAAGMTINGVIIGSACEIPLDGVSTELDAGVPTELTVGLSSDKVN